MGQSHSVTERNRLKEERKKKEKGSKVTILWLVISNDNRAQQVGNCNAKEVGHRGQGGGKGPLGVRKPKHRKFGRSCPRHKLTKGHDGLSSKHHPVVNRGGSAKDVAEDPSEGVDKDQEDHLQATWMEFLNRRIQKKKKPQKERAYRSPEGIAGDHRRAPDEEGDGSQQRNCIQEVHKPKASQRKRKKKKKKTLFEYS